MIKSHFKSEFLDEGYKRSLENESTNMIRDKTSIKDPLPFHDHWQQKQLTATFLPSYKKVTNWQIPC